MTFDQIKKLIFRKICDICVFILKRAMLDRPVELGDLDRWDNR